MNPNVQVTRASATDVPGLVALLAKLFSLEQDFEPDPVRQQRALEWLLARPEQAVVLTAREPSAGVIGMVSAQLVVSTAEGGYAAWIEDVVVQAPFRGQGIGRALLHSALDWARARGASRAQLLVDADNQHALLFYEKLGWEVTHLTARRIFLRPK